MNVFGLVKKELLTEKWIPLLPWAACDSMTLSGEEFCYFFTAFEEIIEVPVIGCELVQCKFCDLCLHVRPRKPEKVVHLEYLRLDWIFD